MRIYVTWLFLFAFGIVAGAVFWMFLLMVLSGIAIVIPLMGLFGLPSKAWEHAKLLNKGT